MLKRQPVRQIRLVLSSPDSPRVTDSTEVLRQHATTSQETLWLSLELFMYRHNRTLPAEVSYEIAQQELLQLCWKNCVNVRKVPHPCGSFVLVWPLHLLEQFFREIDMPHQPAAG
jgi:hypothetical protein